MSFYLKGMANYIVSAAVLFTVSASLFGSKIDNFPGSFKLGDLNNTNCIACKAVVDTVLDVGIAHFKKNITDAAIKACNFFVYIKLPHIDESVCEQYVYAYEDDIIEVIKNTALDSQTICGIVDLCVKPGPSEMNEWNVKISKKEKPKPDENPQQSNVTYKVLHISDVHIDDKYQENGEVNCHQPLCCRTLNNSETTSFAGKWGTKGLCDLPRNTVDALLKHANGSNVDYIIFTGDIPPHAVWDNETTNESPKNAAEAFFAQLRKIFRVPVYPAAGNHDIYPDNNFRFHGLPLFYRRNPIYTTYLDLWERQGSILNNAENIERMGSYDVPLPGNPNLHIISLNTNYGNPANFWLYVNHTDPDGVLQWLSDSLETAENKSYKVQLIAHLQPSDCLPNFSRNLKRILNRFEHTIVGQFYGQSHFDEFKVYYDNGDINKPVGVALMPGSVTTYPGKNPDYRVYTIDGLHENSTYKILDYENYYLDLEESNKGEPKFLRKYSAKDTYGLEAFEPADWSKLITRMASNASLFENFLKFRGARTDACNDDCRWQILCDLRDHPRNKPDCQDLYNIIFPQITVPPNTDPTPKTKTGAIAKLSILSAIVTLLAAMFFSQ